MLVRLVLPPECRIGVVGRPRSAVKMIRSLSSADTAVIPRLIRVPTSQTVSSAGSSSSNGNNSSFISTLLKRRSLPSSSASVLSPSSGSSTIPSHNSASTYTHSILKQNLSPKSASLSSPSNISTTSIRSSSMSASTQSVSKQQSQPFRTQMILFQQKEDGTISNTVPGSGRTRLLEISSNCTWEHIRHKVFARLSGLSSNSVGYPQTCAISVDGFRLEVQPRPEQPTVIPTRLQASLGLSSMFAIRLRIIAEESLPTAGSFSLAASVAESSTQKRKFPNGLNVAPVHSLSVDDGVDVAQQRLTSTLARHRMQETATIDSCQHAMTSATIDSSRRRTSIDASPQSIAIDVSQHTSTGLLESTKFLRKDESSRTKSACAGDNCDVEKWPEPIAEVETATQDCCSTHEETGLELNGRINTSSRVDFDSSTSCGALQQQADDTAVIISDDSSVDAECSEVENSSVCAGDQNFLSSADNVNFPSSSDQTVPAADCIEVMCSLPADDDGHFPSSSSLSVPIACPLDLRT